MWKSGSRAAENRASERAWVDSLSGEQEANAKLEAAREVDQIDAQLIELDNNLQELQTKLAEGNAKAATIGADEGLRKLSITLGRQLQAEITALETQRTSLTDRKAKLSSSGTLQ